MARNLDPLDAAVREQWLRAPGITNAELGALMCGLFPVGLESEGGRTALQRRVKAARAAIPYSRASETTTEAKSEPAVFALLEQRKDCRAAKEWVRADQLLKELQAMGVTVDDKHKTWTSGPLLAAAAAELAEYFDEEETAGVACEPVTFTDTDGDVSSLQLAAPQGGGDGASRVLSWWSGGRCFAKDITGLVLRTTLSPGGAHGEVHTLATSSGQPRATIAGGECPTLLQDLSRITAACSSACTLTATVVQPGDGTVVATAAPASGTMGAKARRLRTNNDKRRSKRKRQRTCNRTALHAALEQLQPPSNYTSVCALAIADMSDVLLELRCHGSQRSHSEGDSGGGGGESAEAVVPEVVFAGIDWAALPTALSMFSDVSEAAAPAASAAAAAIDDDDVELAAAKQSAKGVRQRQRAKQSTAGTKRLERKRRQCDAFAAAIAALNLRDQTLVVDFGCGSCGLTLPLAWAFPRLRFCGVDIKKAALELMTARATAAGLTNTQ